MEVNDNQPKVDANTKFEARGFRKADAEEAPAEEVLGGMIEDGQELSAEEADAAAEAIQTQPEDGDSAEDGETEAEAPRKEPKIKIGTREFENAEDAWAYAQELEQEKVAADAFRHGVEVASKTAPGNTESVKQAEPEEDEHFDTEFYADPKGFLKKYGQKITEQVTRQIKQEADTQNKNEQTWTKFKSTYPDLSGPDEFSDVQTYIFRPENWENLKHLETDKALKIAADAVREKYSRILKNKLPGQELKTVKTPTSPGNGINVTPKKTDEPALNFVAQAKQWKAKRTAKPMRR